MKHDTLHTPTPTRDSGKQKRTFVYLLTSLYVSNVTKNNVFLITHIYIYSRGSNSHNTYAVHYALHIKAIYDKCYQLWTWSLYSQPILATHWLPACGSQLRSQRPEQLVGRHLYPFYRIGDLLCLHPPLNKNKKINY